MIKFWIRDRQTGKTSDLVEWLKAAPVMDRAIIVHSQMEVDRIRAEYNLDELGFTSFAVLSYDQVSSGFTRGLRVREIAIDNVDLLLMHLFRPHIVTVATATGEIE